MAVPMNMSDAVNTLNPAVQYYANVSFKSFEKLYEKIVSVEPITVRNHIESGVSGLPDLVMMPEGSSYPEQNEVETYNTAYQANKFGSAISYTDYLRYFDLTGGMIIPGDASFTKNTGEKISRGVIQTLNRAIFSMFNNGYNSAFQKFGDGKPLFSVSHPLKDSATSTTTYSNASSTSAPLNTDSLNDARISILKTLDDRGNNVGAVEAFRMCLVVPIELTKKAFETIGSPYNPETSNNTINYFPNLPGGFDIIASPFLTSTTAWYVVVPEVAQLKLKMFRDVSVQSFIEGKTDTLFYTYNLFYDFGWSNWRFTYGSKGDGTAYSG